MARAPFLSLLRPPVGQGTSASYRKGTRKGARKGRTPCAQPPGGAMAAAVAVVAGCSSCSEGSWVCHGAQGLLPPVTCVLARATCAWAAPCTCQVQCAARRGHWQGRQGSRVMTGRRQSSAKTLKPRCGWARTQLQISEAGEGFHRATAGSAAKTLTPRCGPSGPSGPSCKPMPTGVEIVEAGSHHQEGWAAPVPAL